MDLYMYLSVNNFRKQFIILKIIIANILISMKWKESYGLHTCYFI